MELDKQLSVPAPPERVWALLLDPQVMGACVPGLQSIEVLSDTEYLAQMQVKLAFITAKFKIRTTVVEQRPPHYLRSEGVGEDASVASSFKQVSEITLTATEAGHTAVRMTIRVDLLGRLGTFGLAVMKTKADRLWDEFGLHLIARATAGDAVVDAVADGLADGVADAVAGGPAVAGPAQPTLPQPALAPTAAAAALAPSGNGSVVRPGVPALVQARPGWWQRLTGRADPQTCIQVIVERNNSRVEVRWPLQDAKGCEGWLRELLREGGSAPQAADASAAQR